MRYFQGKKWNIWREKLGFQLAHRGELPPSQNKICQSSSYRCMDRISQIAYENICKCLFLTEGISFTYFKGRNVADHKAIFKYKIALSVTPIE